MRMKYLVAFPAMFLTTGIILWLIFDSFGDGAATQTSGFNQNMPEPDAKEIVSDKRDAYATQKDTINVTAESIPLVDSVPKVREETQPNMVESSNLAIRRYRLRLMTSSSLRTPRLRRWRNFKPVSMSWRRRT